MGVYTSKYTGEQIDNLLGQVENGGGSTGGSSKVTLWEGSINTANQTATLSQSQEDFDYIGIKSNIKNANNVKRYLPVDWIDTNDIKKIYGTSEKIIIANFSDFSASSSLLLYVGFDDATTMKISSVNKQGTINSFEITEIVGVKY